MAVNAQRAPLGVYLASSRSAINANRIRKQWRDLSVRTKRLSTSRGRHAVGATEGLVRACLTKESWDKTQC